MSLAMAELAGAIPDEGGYVAWVRRAFGPFWGFQVGWWSWINSFVDVAIYPALFADYAMYWWPGMSPAARWALALLFIWALTALNVAGVRVTGWTAVALGVGALAPVALSPCWPARARSTCRGSRSPPTRGASSRAWGSGSR